MERGDRYVLWPICKTADGWSVPDELFIKLWQQMVEEGRAAKLFYGGTVTDEYGWIDWLKDPKNFSVIVMDAREKKIAAVGWLNNFERGTAQIHFCFYGFPHPGAGIKVLEYYSKFPGLHVIVGITPEEYTTAIRYAKRIGFKEIGVIPNMLQMAYENRRMGAVITHYQVRR
jgi:hypothetical protein